MKEEQPDIQPCIGLGPAGTLGTKMACLLGTEHARSIVIDRIVHRVVNRSIDRVIVVDDVGGGRFIQQDLQDLVPLFAFRR